jgi:branched-subunit amino acid ABC-type transport system permease component
VDAGVLLQALLSGLSTGAVLGLVALGFTLVAGTVRVLHLAHGDLAVGAVFTGVLAVLGTTPVATALAPGPAVAFAVLVLSAGALLSAAVALLAVAPNLPDPASGRPGDALGWVAGGVAAGLLLRELLGLLLPQEGYAVPDPLRLASLTDSGVFALPGGQVVSARVPAVLALALVAGVLAERLLVRSRFGKALRAVADDPDAAALCGVSDAAGRAAGLRRRRAARRARRPARRPGPHAVRRRRRGARPVRHRRGAARGVSGRCAGALVGGLVLGRPAGPGRQPLRRRWTDVVPLGLLVLLLALRPEGTGRRPAPVAP